tara:strand:+ start:1290 stop:1514 length:225 start_codon:yes stop_codon:yes gene_type:complete
MSNSLNNLGEDMKKAGLFSSQHMLLRTALYLNFALIATLLVEGAGFEPAEAEASDLQSDGFDRSPTPPIELCIL